jgi:hypothetical protein
MKHIRQNRKAVTPLRKLIGRPAVYTWTGNKAFNRSKGAKFGDLARILDDDEFRAFLTAIGWVEINWAIMEQNLDRWTQLIFRWLDGASIESEVPKSFWRKSKFLRQSFNSIPLLLPFKERGIDILSRADKLAGTGNDLTHAVITSMVSKDGKYEMKNLRLNKDAMHTIIDVQFDARGFPDLSLKLVHLGRDALYMSADLLDAFGERQ